MTYKRIRQTFALYVGSITPLLSTIHGEAIATKSGKMVIRGSMNVIRPSDEPSASRFWSLVAKTASPRATGPRMAIASAALCTHPARRDHLREIEKAETTIRDRKPCEVALLLFALVLG